MRGRRAASACSWRGGAPHDALVAATRWPRRCSRSRRRTWRGSPPSDCTFRRCWRAWRGGSSLRRHLLERGRADVAAAEPNRCGTCRVRAERGDLPAARHAVRARCWRRFRRSDAGRSSRTGVVIGAVAIVVRMMWVPIAAVAAAAAEPPACAVTSRRRRGRGCSSCRGRACAGSCRWRRRSRCRSRSRRARPFRIAARSS